MGFQNLTAQVTDIFTVNGKTAVFTDEERLMFRKALQDLSEKMSAVAMSI